MFSQLIDLFKVRIGLLMAVTAIAGVAAVPGGLSLAAGELLLLAVLVLAASASSGAFNQFMERDLDARMKRTARRPFVTGYFRHGRYWLAGIVALLAVSVAMAGWAFNAAVALYLFLGAFTYGVVYTVWLKPRTAWNIVIGGLAGSFAVLAGAAAVDPQMNAAAIWLAVVLFLWTPPHFWSLAIAIKDQYAEAGVPMLPVVAGDRAAARVILLNTVVLTGASLVPCWYGMGYWYGGAALIGGGWFCYRSAVLLRDPGKANAMRTFLASILQLSLLLVGTIIDAL